MSQSDWRSMERKAVLPATGNDDATVGTFLQVTGGGGNLEDGVQEVHLCIYDTEGGQFAQGWFRLDDLEATLARVYMGDLDPAAEGCGLGDELTECGQCYGVWCDRCDPAHGPLCPWCHGMGYSTAAITEPRYRQANHVLHNGGYPIQEVRS